MEAWKDELYHYGIKGMKWGKKKMSRQEQNARAYESAARHVNDAEYVANYHKDRAKKYQKVSDYHVTTGDYDQANSFQKRANESRKKSNAAKKYVESAKKRASNAKYKIRKGKSKVSGLFKRKDKQETYRTGDSTVTMTHKKKGRVMSVSKGSYKSTKYIPNKKG